MGCQTAYLELSLNCRAFFFSISFILSASNSAISFFFSPIAVACPALAINSGDYDEVKINEIKAKLNHSMNCQFSWNKP